MSASLNKKKLSQLELRKRMQQHKLKERPPVKKIDSPLAKYDEQGQLTCALCKSVVRSEAVWSVHINAKQHKENVELAKKLKERTNNFTTPLKRPLTPPLQVPSKKPKSILKNGSSTSKTEETSSNKGTTTESGLPEDFFNASSGKKAESIGKVSNYGNKMGKPAMGHTSKEANETLPEGFFDDPKLDAKARNIEYKDPIQEEWERFQKEIKDAEGESAAIIAEDEDEATTERKLDIIDEQIKHISKVVIWAEAWDKKKAEVAAMKEKMDVVENEEEEDLDIDLDEAFDWRSKNPFK